MKATDKKKISAGYEPITGYVLEKLIGRGGFGEVWRADAPGGLKKAVKFVFGAHDQQRASRELKSLERIKGVSHPFLLTLERFGIVDDQLVIVTELADGSLEDVFREHRDRGSCGIPRDKLLSFLHDAADALDYLHQHYQLQHLDIKPGNLLIVGGHVKVADFGLLKDLREVECSVVGGLTPVYAPPEVFDGRPSLHSDQYSLAVMYQELLTGTRPFSGRTIAQLATQHVHNAPDLEPLPPCDRPAMARALEKNPDRRFTNCREFVEALTSPRHRVTNLQRSTNELPSEDTDETIGAGFIARPKKAEDLPALGDGAIERVLRTKSNVMIVALGGTGADILSDFRARISSMHSACPINFHGVLIDTDEKTLGAVRIGNTHKTLPPVEIVSIPLRSPNEYRQSLSGNRLATISRRWIYNVPRSLATEGMRPLGRLALVDHGPKVIKSLERVIQDFAQAPSNDTHSVYVVGSLSGGTGSGIYLDVVHLLRHLLDTNGLAQTKILSMLAMKGLSQKNSSSIALHDAQAALIEMRHYLQPENGYPGDVGANWPSVPAARTPLKNTYIVASNESDPEAPSPAQIIGDYVWTDATGAGTLLADARKLEIDPKSQNPISIQLRSVGIIPLGVVRRPEEKVLVPATVQHLLMRWLGHPGNAKKHGDALGERFAKRSQISSDQLSQFIASKLAPNQTARREMILARIAAEEAAQGFQFESESIRTLVATWVQESVDESEIEKILDEAERRLSLELFNRLSHCSADLATSIHALGWFQNRIESDANADKSNGSQAFDESLVNVSASLCSLDKTISEAIAQMAHQQMQAFSARIEALVLRLNDLATTLAISISGISAASESNVNPWSGMPKEISDRFEPILLELHTTAVNQLLIRPLMQGVFSVDPNLVNVRLTEAVSPMIGSALAQPSSGTVAMSTSSELNSGASNCDATVTLQNGVSIAGNESTTTTTNTNTTSPAKGRTGGEVTSMSRALQLARPELLDCGGVQRLILVVGTHSEQVRLEAEIRQFHTGSLTTSLIPGSTAKLIHEAQRIDLNDVIARLTTLNAGNQQVSARLMTRTDIDWRKSEPRSIR